MITKYNKKYFFSAPNSLSCALEAFSLTGASE